MIPLPEWAPNVHPIIVHFPIALLVIAWEWLADVALALAYQWDGLEGVVLLAGGVIAATAAPVTLGFG